MVDDPHVVLAAYKKELFALRPNDSQLPLWQFPPENRDTYQVKKGPPGGRDGSRSRLPEGLASESIQAVVCPQCTGRGVVSDSQGLFAFSQPCPRCQGNGSIVEKPCRHCRGSGRERATKRYAVKIPAGARSGTRVRLKGKGEAGRNGGPAGDLYVVVDVEPSPLFERRGADLVLEVPVTYAEAALGASIQIPTPEGSVSLKVPAGTESGKLLRVKGHGAPHLRGNGRGDLLARLTVTVPKKLTKAEKEALEGYQKVSREPARWCSARDLREAARSPASALGDPYVPEPRRARVRRRWLDRRSSASRSASAAPHRARCAAGRDRGADAGRPRYMISVAADLVGMHPQTLRMYEAKGLVRPGRTPGGTRLYSDADIERLRLIQRLTTELGLNLAGVEHVLRLQDELNRARARMERLERELKAEIAEVHRSYKREVVLPRMRRRLREMT
jgi:DNA-binding transcriptional MerR regulator